MHGFFRFKKFLSYQYRAKTKYYLHSPFVYQFYLNVLDKGPDQNLQRMAAFRKKLASDKTTVPVTDFGPGKRNGIKLAEAEKNIAVTHKYGSILYYLISYFKPETIIELGTSIGLSSAYMALGNGKCELITVDGAESLTAFAKLNHQKLGINNTQFITGNFDVVLPIVLGKLSTVDLVFFDGNHQKDATLAYFNMCMAKANEKSIFIFDDIYWSPDMEQAWLAIKADPRVKLTIDLFQFGICFFDTAKVAKEDFILR